MKKNIILYLIVILTINMCQGIFAMQTTEAERKDYNKMLNSIAHNFWVKEFEVKQLIAEGKFVEAYKKYNELKSNYNFLKDFYEEAKTLGYPKAGFFHFSPELYEDALKDLEKSISQAQTQTKE